MNLPPTTLIVEPGTVRENAPLVAAQTFDRTGRPWLDADPCDWRWPINVPYFPEAKRPRPIYDQEREHAAA